MISVPALVGTEIVSAPTSVFCTGISWGRNSDDRTVVCTDDVILFIHIASKALDEHSIGAFHPCLHGCAGAHPASPRLKNASGGPGHIFECCIELLVCGASMFPSNDVGAVTIGGVVAGMFE